MGNYKITHVTNNQLLTIQSLPQIGKYLFFNKWGINYRGGLPVAVCAKRMNVAEKHSKQKNLNHIPVSITKMQFRFYKILSGYYPTISAGTNCIAQS